MRRNAIINNKHGIYELSRELPNDSNILSMIVRAHKIKKNYIREKGNAQRQVPARTKPINRQMQQHKKRLQQQIESTREVKPLRSLAC